MSKKGSGGGFRLTQPSLKHLVILLRLNITYVLVIKLQARGKDLVKFTVVNVVLGGKQLEVRLNLPWKQHVQIDYLATAVS